LIDPRDRLDYMDNLSYHLHPLVRGRNESFGLLFYNTRDTKLTFVRCGNLLRIGPAAGGISMLEFHCGREAERGMVRRVLQGLTQKGLIVETGVSP
jgi:putative mycofactocin binding protein MftB